MSEYDRAKADLFVLKAKEKRALSEMMARITIMENAPDDIRSGRDAETAACEWITIKRRIAQKERSVEAMIERDMRSEESH